MATKTAPTPTAERLGRALATHRAAAGLSIRELAALAGVSPVTVGNVEAGDLPGRESMLKLLRPLNLDDITQRRILADYADTRVEATVQIGQLPLLWPVVPDDEATKRIDTVLAMGIDGYQALAAGQLIQALVDRDDAAEAADARAWLASADARDLLVLLTDAAEDSLSALLSA